MGLMLLKEHLMQPPFVTCEVLPSFNFNVVPLLSVLGVFECSRYLPLNPSKARELLLRKRSRCRGSGLKRFAFYWTNVRHAVVPRVWYIKNWEIISCFKSGVVCTRWTGPPPLTRGGEKPRLLCTRTYTHTRAPHHSVFCHKVRPAQFPTSAYFRFLLGVCSSPIRCARKRPCLVSTSQRSTGATTVVASARPSHPVHASRTAVATRRRSSSALGKYSVFFQLFFWRHF